MIKLILISLLCLFVPGQVLAAPMEIEAGQLQAHQVETDVRVAHLERFLASYNSPLVSEAQTFIDEADKHNLDWRLVAAIAGTESTFGKRIPPGSYNAWGWGIPTGSQSGIGFNSWAHGIATVSEGLAKNYYGRGAKTIFDVGWRYAANGNSWGTHTAFFIKQLDAFTPASPELLPVSI